MIKFEAKKEKKYNLWQTSIQFNHHRILFISIKPSQWKRFEISAKPIKETFKAYAIHLSILKIAITN